MAVHFHPLTVKEVRKETADCVLITLHVPAGLSEEFKFIQGQNITVKAMINGEEARRSYSICSAPYENELRIAVKLVEGGKFSTYANTHLQKGDVLQVLPPTGKFNTLLHPNNIKNYVAFAAGSGITPVISIIKTTLKTEPASCFTLVYGNRSRGTIAFFEELQGLKNKYIGRFSFIHLLSREITDAPINSGRITPEKLQALSTLINYKKTDEFFICGPESMIFCVQHYLVQQGIAASKVHFELFTVPGQKAPQLQSITASDAQKSKVSIKADGRILEFALAFNTDTILDAALKQGADLPFACKGGVCATCRAKLLQGKVSMKVNYALDQEEIDRGFILTCQSQPASESVLIDFDIK